MKEVERPAPAPVAGFNHGLDGVTDAAVVFNFWTPQDNRGSARGLSAKTSGTRNGSSGL